MNDEAANQKEQNRIESRNHIMAESNVQVPKHYQYLEKGKVYSPIYKKALAMEKSLKEADIIPCELPKADGSYKQSDIYCGIQYKEAKDPLGSGTGIKEIYHTISFRNGGEMLSYLFDENLKLKNIEYCYDSYRKIEDTKTAAEYCLNNRMKDSLKLVYDHFDAYKKEYEDKVSGAMVYKVYNDFKKLLSTDKHNKTGSFFSAGEKGEYKAGSEYKEGYVYLSDIHYTEDGYKFSLKTSSIPKSAYDFYMKNGRMEKIDYRSDNIPFNFIGFHNTILDFYAKELTDSIKKQAVNYKKVENKSITPFDSLELEAFALQKANTEEDVEKDDPELDR